MAKQKVVYVGRVRDVSKKPRFEGQAFRVRTKANPSGQFSSRKDAEAVVKTAIAHDANLRAVGVATEKVDVEPDYRDWLTGNVVDPKIVPAQYLPAYLDTLRRATAAAIDYGQAVHVNESFRTLAQQEYFWNAYQHGGSIAARPGTSLHEKGLALDIPNARSISKLIKALRKQGFKDDVPAEVWHVSNRAYQPA